MSEWMKKLLGINWKTNGLAILIALSTVQPLVTAIVAWAHHQPADWRLALLGVLAALVSWAAKDSTTSSTLAQVQKSTIENPAVEAKAEATPPLAPKS